VKFDAAIANAAWLATSLPEWLRFNHAARRVEATQRSLLGNYLQRNSATEFGKAHGFRAIRDYMF
jgi:hypothetical protein